MRRPVQPVLDISGAGKPYSNAGKWCNLCNAEAYHILHADKDLALNERSELLSACRHQKKFTLAVSAMT